jgi:hypothetical protein
MITVGIPAGLATAPPPARPAPARASVPAAANVTAGDRVIMATALVAGLALVASVFAGPMAVAGLPLASLLALGGGGGALVSLFRPGIQTHRQRTKRPGGCPAGSDIASL